MPDFVILGRVEHAGPREFLAIATATPKNLRQGKPLARTKVCVSRALAEAQRDELVRWLGLELAGRGDRVVDVEVE